MADDEDNDLFYLTDEIGNLNLDDVKQNSKEYLGDKECLVVIFMVITFKDKNRGFTIPQLMDQFNASAEHKDDQASRSTVYTAVRYLKELGLLGRRNQGNAHVYNSVPF